MAEWGVTPDYIVNNWDEELLGLMVDRLNQRKQREQEALQGRSKNLGRTMVSDTELFAQLGGAIKIERKPDAKQGGV